MNSTAQFDTAASGLYGAVREALLCLPKEIRANAEEIRLRKGKPLCITVKSESFFVAQNGALSETEGFTVSEQALNDCFLALCGHSTFAHEEELRQGFLSLKNGGRAGVCGVFSQSGTLCEISSLNIRIAREVFSCADNILKNCSVLGGLLIAGPPASGKTTLLRDLIKQLSDQKHRICVIDSRRELSFGNLGACTDVIINQNRAAAMEMALRTMYPQIIAFDEVGNTDELKAIEESFFGGVSVITTAHAASVHDLLTRSVTKRLLSGGAVAEVVLLSTARETPCFFTAKELLQK